jgi:hypothetical protein
MRILTRHLLLAAAASFLAGVPALAQVRVSERGQPKTPFSTSDFGRLRWLEGTWVGTAAGEQPIYERYHISSDSTIDVTYYRDSAFTQSAGTGRVYLAAGRVYHSLGPGRWGATQVDSASAYFVPQVNAHNTFAWSLVSPDEWTATMRTGVSGHERITVYRMRRVGDRR